MLPPIRNTNGVGVAALLLAISMSTHAAPNAPQTAHHFSRTSTVELSVEYLLFLPQDYDPARAEGWPMILFLHGAGERGSNLSQVKVHGPPKLAARDPDFPFIVVSPQCPQGEIWDNTTLLALLDAVSTTHNVDTNRVYLTGLSMGGFGTWSLGLSHPERFAAIAPICGGGTPLSVWLADEPRKARVRSLRIWAFHGAKDPVVPLEESRRMVDAVMRIGGTQVKLTVYPEALHDSWTATYDNPELFEWFLARPAD
jgi:predicted peptidase